MSSRHERAQRLACRYAIRAAVSQVCSSKGFATRTASLHDLTPGVLEAFAEAFLLEGMPSYRAGFLGKVVQKVKKLWELFKKAPKLWEKIKSFLGVKGVTDLPGKIKKWASDGLKALKKAFKELILENPIVALYVMPDQRMPNITDLMKRLVKSSPRLSKILSKVSTAGVKIDKILKKSPILSMTARPIKAAIFIWIWLQVTEMSWDLPGLVEGFTGGISVADLLSSLPESALGLLIGTLFPGIGTFGLLGVSVIARVAYLMREDVLTWVKGKGFKVNWEKLGVNMQPEMVPIF